MEIADGVELIVATVHLTNRMMQLVRVPFAQFMFYCPQSISMFSQFPKNMVISTYMIIFYWGGPSLEPRNGYHPVST